MALPQTSIQNVHLHYPHCFKLCLMCPCHQKSFHQPYDKLLLHSYLKKGKTHYGALLTALSLY